MWFSTAWRGIELLNPLRTTPSLAPNNHSRSGNILGLTERGEVLGTTHNARSESRCRTQDRITLPHPRQVTDFGPIVTPQFRAPKSAACNRAAIAHSLSGEIVQVFTGEVGWALADGEHDGAAWFHVVCTAAFIAF